MHHSPAESRQRWDLQLRGWGGRRALLALLRLLGLLGGGSQRRCTGFPPLGRLHRLSRLSRLGGLA
jgi:hypothetical protein